MSILWTIGHSNHPYPDFLGLLRMADIDCIADIRSAPYSKRFPHFHREKLAAALKADGLAYVWLGEEFGARRKDPDLLDAEGRLDFAKVRQSESFRQGMARLEQGLAQERRIALMCSEADPLQCHRFSMVAIALHEAGLEVRHLLRDGSQMSHEELEAQLLQYYRDQLPQADLFTPDPDPAEVLRQAYRLHNRDVAYAPGTQW